MSVYFGDDSVKYLKLDDMKVGHLYDMVSRGSYMSCGVAVYKGDGLFNTLDTGMSTWRFGLTKELHWDADDRYGTVKPIKDLGKCPDHLNRDDDRMVQLLVLLSKPIWKKDIDDMIMDVIANS